MSCCFFISYCLLVLSYVDFKYISPGGAVTHNLPKPSPTTWARGSLGKTSVGCVELPVEAELLLTITLWYKSKSPGKKNWLEGWLAGSISDCMDDTYLCMCMHMRMYIFYKCTCFIDSSSFNALDMCKWCSHMNGVYSATIHKHMISVNIFIEKTTIKMNSFRDYFHSTG